MKRMLDLRAHAGLGLLQFLFHPAQRVLLHGFADAALHRNVPRHHLARILGTLVGALVAGVTEHHRLVAVQQLVGLRHVGHVAGCGHQGMRQARLGIDADMGLHAEEPVLALLRLVHLRIALLVPVLGRRRRRDQGRVDNGPFAHHQAFAGQVPVDLIEDPACQIVLLEQAAELEQRRRVRRRLVRQVDADKAADGLAVVDRILDAFVRQAEALLRDVHAQHPLQAHRRPAASFALRVVRQQRSDQCRPWRHRLDLGQEPVAAGLLLLVGELGVGERGLLHGGSAEIEDVIVPARTAAGIGRRLNQCFLSFTSLALAAATTLALLSVSVERVGPEQVQHGNLCGAPRFEPCYKPALKGGFPIGYLYDQPGISVEGKLAFIEDKLYIGALLANIAIYFGALMLVGWIVKRRRPR